MVNPITNLLSSATALTGGSVEQANTPKAPSFSNMVSNAIKSVANDQRAAENVTMQVAVGEQVPMHDVISIVGKADLTLQTMLTVRDRAVEAYQEIQRMPI